ncbi:MAG TPA: ATPase, T2SS/T4P/T4SS family [Candidatus Hydrogenedentes bacterium]|nr:ATPase, T2SS/T4P/T4SS family [Candidatus Hydrogenedentota bacterium]HOD94585.1 ATPase, T2SS/T4P/T4SS family [Candidatus Hydrogenedentota bacterium]HOR50792.1 ATPase, T2SS/T4P/T4SS family [Candidatus Hydrogenedentota bacterium]HPK24010.1 ATPase, T2SS/T4P/T4SS family [Candidatus Hydrogenedentota bacterium]HPX86802.1 ATPase, T2SS/T4P/T4SS family [Candidatus Hydrogenedentota bacterium]
MAYKIRKERLPDMLLAEGLVNKAQLSECVEIHRNTGQSLPSLLVGMGYLDEEDLAGTLSDNLGIPHIRVASCNVSKEVLKEVPESLARQYQMLPVSITGGVLTLAMADPLNIMAIDDLRMVTKYDIEPVVGIMSELRAAIDRFYGGSSEDQLLSTIMGKNAERFEEIMPVQDDEPRENLSAITKGAEIEPVRELVRLILKSGLDQGASDIHIEPFEKLVRVRYRIDGQLEEATIKPPKNMQPNLIARLKILSGCRIDEHRLPQDGRARMFYNDREIDFRVAFLPCKYGEKVVLRILDQGSLTLDLDSLGFEPQPMEAFRFALDMPHGMILLTGPTGSGKTTTLYSALHRLNTMETNIVTVEDPIEYELFGVNQVQVRQRIGFTFAEALRQILRQDPDVVMVGEIRDGETADVAVKAALTGHLVLSTLHTNDASGVFPRLIDMDVEPFLVQSSVALAAAQRLLKRLCNECKQPVDIPEEVLQRVQYTPFSYIEKPQFYNATGCSKCKETGYKGRVAVVEVMLNWPELQPLVLGRASGHEIKEQAIACGMKTLRQNSLSKAAQGVTTIQQVLEHTIAD